MYPNSNILRNTWPVFPGIGESIKKTPLLKKEKMKKRKLVYGILNEEFDSIDLCEFISPGFISFPGRTDGYYGQDPTPDPNTPQPGQPGKKPNRQPEVPDPGRPQIPHEHPGRVQPEREITRPAPPVIPPVSPPNTPDTPNTPTKFTFH